MKTNWFFFLILLSLTHQRTARQDVCPPWLFLNQQIYHWMFLQWFSCRHQVWDRLLHCCIWVTVWHTIVQLKYRPCPYISHYNTTHVFYIQLPKNVCLLNEFMCGSLNREGRLCGKCKNGYGTALYSYTLECSKCRGHGYGWVLYYFLELFPITVMYFLVT